MKKIVLFTSEFPPGPGGIGSHAYGLALSLKKSGFVISVIADFRDIHNVRDTEWDGTLPFKVYRIKNRRPRPFTYLERLYKLGKLLKAGGTDIVIASGKFPLMFAPVVVDRMKRKPKMIGVVHGTEANSKGFSGWWLRKQLEKFDGIVCVSKYTARLVQVRFGVENIKVIPNGFEPNKFRRNNNNCNFELEGFPSLLTVGTISQRKGQHNVVRALPYILRKYPDVIYHVVGLSRDAVLLYDSIRRLGLQDRVKIHGVLDDEAISCALQSADVFMMLSETTSTGDTEGFGIAIIEANHFGKPAIGSTGTGIEDAIKNGFNGMLVDPRNPGEILMALDTIMSNYEEYSKNAVIWAKEHTWDKVVKKYIALFE